LFPTQIAQKIALASALLGMDLPTQIFSKSIITATLNIQVNYLFQAIRFMALAKSPQRADDALRILGHPL
jgi:hypothetical protein